MKEALFKALSTAASTHQAAQSVDDVIVRDGALVHLARRPLFTDMMILSPNQPQTGLFATRELDGHGVTEGLQWHGSPNVYFHNELKDLVQEIGVTSCLVSMAHDGEYATAVAVLS